MSDTKYTYAVARIRALEVSLFSSSTIEQLIACKDHESCLRFLTEHGWGGVDVPLNADAILTREQEKSGRPSGRCRWTWMYLMSSLIPTGSTT